MDSPNPRTGHVRASPPNPDREIRVGHARNYPHYTWFCFAAVIGLASFLHFTSLAYRFYVSRRPASSTLMRKRGVIQFSRLPVAVADTFQAIAFRWTIPVGSSYTLNLTELFLTAGYIVVVLILTLVNSTNLAGLKYDPKYWANVAGAVAAAQLPLITALGMKNNIIGFLTGVSAEKLNYLHRMSARTIIIVIWLHAGGRLKLGLKGSTAAYHGHMVAGFLAGSALVLLALCSLKPIRKRGYEFFLFLHFAMVLILIVGTHVHTQEYAKPFINYAWPALVIWGFDRLVRFIRIVLFNTSFSGIPRPALDAHVEPLSQGLLKITLPRPAHSLMNWNPGQSANLSVVPSLDAWRKLGWVAFEMHPFTIASVDYAHTMTKPGSTQTSSSELEKKSQQTKTEDGKKLMFLVKVQNGFTKRLMKATRGGDLHMKCIVDGPYGETPLLKGYDTIVLIAGGSGISFTLPLLLDLISRAKRGKPACSRVVFIWAIRNTGSTSWIAEELLPALQGIPSSCGCTFDIRIFVTGAQVDGTLETLEIASPTDTEPTSPDVEKSDSGSENLKGGLLSELPGVSVKTGRPDVVDILQNEVANATGDVSVNVCGNYAINNSVRQALSPIRFSEVLKGGPSVNLHVETFGDV